MTDTAQLPRRFLLAVFVVGVGAFALAAWGIMEAHGIAFTLDLSVDGWVRFTQVVFGALGVLGLNEPPQAPDSGVFATARFLSICFTLLAASGILFEFYRPLRTALRRFRLRCQHQRGKSTATVIGLGWIGHAIADDLRKDDRPVYGVDIDAGRGEELERDGVLVVEGDATDPNVLARAGLDDATEVFIATGSDTRNLEVAGEIVSTASPTPRHCYVHVGDPTLADTLRAKGLFANAETNWNVHLFCTQELAAQDLFLDLFLNRGLGVIDPSTSSDRPRPQRFPLCEDKQVHLFVLGFGSLGQAIALHTARFAHTPADIRPRLTVVDPDAPNHERWDDFLDAHPAFAPRSLSLDTVPIGADAWDDQSYRAASTEYRTRDPQPADSPELASRRPTAVEYAVQAEYLPLRDGTEPGAFLDVVDSRLNASPTTIPVFIFCLDDDRQSFRVALSLQQALARRHLEFPPSSDDDASDTPGDSDETPLAPLLIHLPVERGLSNLLQTRHHASRKESVLIDRHLPLYAFGERHTFASYSAITRGGTQSLMDAVQSVHASLSPHGGVMHPDFDRSNFDAILFAEMRFAAIGITFLTEEEARTRDDDPLLQSLFPEQLKAELAQARKTYFDDARKLYVMTADDLTQLPEKVRERLAIIESIEAPSHDDKDKKRKVQSALKAAKQQAVQDAIHRFEAELRSRNSPDPDIAARMEHNRWMGERFASDWKFGSKSNVRKQRETFLTWDKLTKDERRYDRYQQPRLILALERRRLYAYPSLS